MGPIIRSSRCGCGFVSRSVSSIPVPSVLDVLTVGGRLFVCWWHTVKQIFKRVGCGGFCPVVHA